MQIKKYVLTLFGFIDKYARYFAAGIFGIFLVALSSVSLLFTTYYGADYVEKPLYRHDSVYLVLLALSFFLLSLYLFDRRFGIEKIKTEVLLKILQFYVFIVAICWVYMAKSSPVADSSIVSAIAGEFLDKDYSALYEGHYLYIYPFQLGIVSLLEAIYFIFGKDSYQVFQILNAFFVTLGFTALCKCSELMFNNKKVTNLLILFLFGCFPPIMYSTFVYGNVISMSLSLVAVWMLLLFFKTSKLRFAFFSAISILTSVMIKNNALIVLIAICILLFLKFLGNRKIIFLFLIPVILMCNSVTELALQNHYESRANIHINKGAPKILWFAMGLQEGSMAPGWYNCFSYNPYVDSKFDTEKTEKIAKESIKESLEKFKKEPKYAVKFMCLKFGSQWNDPSYQSFWVSTCFKQHDGELSSITNSLYHGKLNRLALCFMNFYHFFIIFMALLFVLFKKCKLTLNQCSLLIIILGGFFFHMLWEAKGQYIFPYFLMLVPYAAAGAEKVLSFMIKAADIQWKSKLK